MPTNNKVEKVSVNAEALRQVLQALIGPPHHIRELQFTRDLPGNSNPINILIEEYNDYVEKSNSAEEEKTG